MYSDDCNYNRMDAFEEYLREEAFRKHQNSLCECGDIRSDCEVGSTEDEHLHCGFCNTFFQSVKEQDEAVAYAKRENIDIICVPCRRKYEIEGE